MGMSDPCGNCWAATSKAEGPVNAALPSSDDKASGEGTRVDILIFFHVLAFDSSIISSFCHHELWPEGRSDV